MKVLPAIAILIVAAITEAGGDALVRAGLLAPTSLRRASFLLVGALVLFVYAVTINAPRWDFGKLIGVYVAVFFLAAQVIAYFGFHTKPTTPIMLGGSFIVIGGLVISLWRG